MELSYARSVGRMGGGARLVWAGVCLQAIPVFLRSGENTASMSYPETTQISDVERSVRSWLSGLRSTPATHSNIPQIAQWKPSNCANLVSVPVTPFHNAPDSSAQEQTCLIT